MVDGGHYLLSFFGGVAASFKSTYLSFPSAVCIHPRLHSREEDSGSAVRWSVSRSVVVDRSCHLSSLGWS